MCWINNYFYVVQENCYPTNLPANFVSPLQQYSLLQIESFWVRLRRRNGWIPEISHPHLRIPELPRIPDSPSPLASPLNIDSGASPALESANRGVTWRSMHCHVYSFNSRWQRITLIFVLQKMSVVEIQPQRTVQNSFLGHSVIDRKLPRD